MLDKYWPTNEQVSQCIRTEAEELSSYVLQAVHEPMHLRTYDISNAKTVDITGDAETQLLEHLKTHSRPIPILGDAGSGKSHLIRLLDVQLQYHPDTKGWIVKRIPKSSSLRQVLEILLDGMPGENFEKLRQGINDVGETLNTGEVAEQLIVFINYRLQELYDTTLKKVQELRNTGAKVSEEEMVKLKTLKQHAQLNKLPALLSDSNFKDRLIKPGCCLHNIAQRITSGSTAEEIIENDYAITVANLELDSVVLDDFSSKAKEYVRDQQLQSNPGKREEVVALLNEILTDACRIAFQRFFNFSSGQFQELFVDIRKALLGKTLVILVEDMAAITAIENDLIDSLLLEGTRDGVQTLCTVKSAIAVTTGYEGYQRRQSTIATRSGSLEWNIEKRTDNDIDLYQRIENFCARYLNTARYNRGDIVASIENNNAKLLSWHDDSLKELSRSALDSFGVSDQGYSLFPYNKAAFRALADTYCRNSLGELEFNPRRILSHILIPILRDFRSLFLQGEFPPANFLGLLPSSSLQAQIRISDLSKRAQSLSAVTFWGHTTTDKAMLVNFMPAGIATAMGMDELAELLANTTPLAPGEMPEPVGQSVAKEVVVTNAPGVIEEVTPPQEVNYSSDVDNAFRAENITEKMARQIRNELYEIIKSEFSHCKRWSGVNFDILKIIKTPKKAPLIEIPFINNNPSKSYASFGSKKIFSDNNLSLKYKQFVVAVLKKSDNDGVWDESLYEDYCRYQNFSQEWVRDVIPSIILQIQQEQLFEHLKPAVKMASIVHPGFISATLAGKLNILCDRSKVWRDDLFSRTGEEEWDNYKNTMIEDWDKQRKKWIDYVAFNDHAISRDLLKPHLEKAAAIEFTDKIALKTQRSMLAQHSELYGCLADCGNKVSFIEVFTAMGVLIKKMNDNGRFKHPDDEITYRKTLNRIEKVISEDEVSSNWLSTSNLLKLLGPFTLESFVKAISAFDINKLQVVSEALEYWQRVYSYSLQEYKDINLANDSLSRVEKEGMLVTKLSEGHNMLRDLLANPEALSHESE